VALGSALAAAALALALVRVSVEQDIPDMESDQDAQGISLVEAMVSQDKLDAQGKALLHKNHSQDIPTLGESHKYL
jgi:hypothetical protein